MLKLACRYRQVKEGIIVYKYLQQGTPVARHEVVEALRKHASFRLFKASSASNTSSAVERAAPSGSPRNTAPAGVAAAGTVEDQLFAMRRDAGVDTTQEQIFAMRCKMIHQQRKHGSHPIERGTLLVQQLRRADDDHFERVQSQ